MKEIPYRGRREYYDTATVYDNLVAADVNLLTRHDRDSKSRGIHFHFGRELESVEFKPRAPTVASVSVSWSLANDLGSLRTTLTSWCAKPDAA